MATIANLAVKLSMDSSDFDSGLKGAQNSAESLVNKLSKLGGAMTAGVTLPLLAIGGAAVAMSNSLNASMANIGSLGIGTDRLVEMKSAIQDLSIETGSSTADMADGMYQVVSAFGDGADSLAILRTNAKLAKSGLSTVSEAIALTSAVTKGYNDTSAEAVAHTADLASMTVALGQTTLPELAGAMGVVTPLAGNLGVGMEDLFAVMATGSGVTGTASGVATQFRGILQSLMVPTADMTKLTKSMGYENAQAMLAGEGLQKTIQAIVGAAESTGKPLQSFIGSIEGQTLALALAGPQADSFTKNLDALGKAGGAADAAFLAQTTGINAVGFSMEQVQAKAAVFGQKVGDGLAPLLSIGLDKIQPLADGLIDLVDSFAKLDSSSQGWILAGIGLVAALGPLLMILPGIVAGVKVVSGAVAALSGPVGLAILAVIGLGAAWYTNFGGIQDKTLAVIEAMRPAFEQLQKWFDMAMKGDFSGLQVEIGAALTSVKVAVANFRWADYITPLTDWATYITKLDWNAYVVLLYNWAAYITKIVWGDYITPLDWKTIGITTIDWAMWIPAILWTLFITPLVWSGQIAGFVWNTFVENLKWKDFVTVLKDWAKLVNPINWILYINNLAWTSFIAKLDWVTVGKIAEFTWDSFIEKVSWLSFIPLLKWPTIDVPEWGDFIPDLEWPSIPGFPGWVEILKAFGFGALLPGAAPAAAAAKIPMATGGLNTTSPGYNNVTNLLDSLKDPPKPGGRARGGPVSSGVPYIVGERGAELFMPKTAGTIIPNDALGAAGGVTVNNYGDLNNGIDLNALAWQVASVLKRRG